MKNQHTISYFLLFFGILQLPFGLTAQRQETKEKRYRNFKGAEIEDVFGIGIKRYYYKNQRLVKLDLRSKTGEIIPFDKWLNFYPATFLYDYNTEGKLVKRVATDSLGNPMDLDGFYDSAIQTYSYNNKGQLAEMRFYDQDENLLEMGDGKQARHTYRYDSLGNCIEIISYDASGNELNGRNVYEYDENGRPIKEITYNQKDQTYSVLFEYNDQGYCTWMREDLPDTLRNYSIYFSRTNSMIDTVFTYRPNNTREITQVRRMEFDLPGWDFHMERTKFPPFKHHGLVRFHVKLDENGKIIDLTPDENKTKANMDFIQEVYAFFQNKSLIRTSEQPNELSGSLEVEIPEEPSVYRLLTFIKSPSPTD
ncbi:MAG: hypothetical protein AAFY71_02605 [Bacteroidota bacterium]